MTFYLLQSEKDAEPTLDNLLHKIEVYEVPDHISTERSSDMHGVVQYLEPVLDHLSLFGVPRNETEAIMTKYLECGANAYEHGNKGDPTKKVTSDVVLGRAGVLLVLKDNGTGFTEVPEGLYAKDGKKRGNGYTTWLRDGFAYRTREGFTVVVHHRFEKPLDWFEDIDAFCDRLVEIAKYRIELAGDVTPEELEVYLGFFKGNKNVIKTLAKRAVDEAKVLIHDEQNSEKAEA